MKHPSIFIKQKRNTKSIYRKIYIYFYIYSLINIDYKLSEHNIKVTFFCDIS